jgi:hypothetical protein
MEINLLNIDNTINNNNYYNKLDNGGIINDDNNYFNNIDNINDTVNIKNKNKEVTKNQINNDEVEDNNQEQLQNHN